MAEPKVKAAGPPWPASCFSRSGDSHLPILSFDFPDSFNQTEVLQADLAGSQLGSLARKKRTLWTDIVPERPPLEKI